MAELRGDGGARLIEEKPQMGFDFLTPKFVNLLTPLSLFGAKRYLHYICLLKSFLCHSKTTTWTGGPVLETCCEKNKCKIHQIAILPKEGQRNWKNKIEKRKWNVEICFLVREENENFCKKDFKFFVTRKRNSPTTIPISVLYFLLLHFCFIFLLS